MKIGDRQELDDSSLIRRTIILLLLKIVIHTPIFSNLHDHSCVFRTSGIAEI
jgi:hypothetical protein